MRRAYLVLVAVCSFWGTVPLVAERTGLPPIVIAFGRVWFAALGLGVVLIVRDRRGLRAGGAFGRHPVLLLASGLLLAAHWTAMFAAYDRAPDDVVAFIVFLAPIGIAASAPRALGERLGPWTLVALAVAVAGLVLVAGPSRSSAGTAGLVLAGVAAATFVLIVLLGKPLAEELGGARLTLLQMTIAGCALTLPAMATGGLHTDGPGWGWLAVLGLVHTGVGTALYLSALSRVPATHAGIIGYLEPVGVVAFGWLLADGHPRVTTLAGGTLIIAAGAMVIAVGEERRGGGWLRDREEVAVGVPR